MLRSAVNTKGEEKLETLFLWKAVIDQYGLKEGCLAEKLETHTDF